MHLRALCRNLGATDNNFSSLDDHVKSHQLKARSACPRHGVVAGAGPGAGGRVRVSTRVFLHGEQPECTCAGAMRRNTSGVQMLANLVRSTVPAAHLPVVDLSPPPAPVPPLTKPPASAQPLSEEETPFISRS